jgi:phage terminase Nu1 subunit (DNA packaging protein)
MNATELLAAIRTGKVLYISTHYRVTKIDAKTVAKFEKAGCPVIKNGADGHLYLASGRNYVDCHYCAIKLVNA